MQQATDILRRIIDNVEQVIVGKRHTVELALTAVISGGHILVEDVPGVGKTSLVSAFARSIDCSFKRIQFTPDVMPSDITGFSMYNPKLLDFEYKPGAVLHQFVQADEINRTSSKTQAALLEVMEERQVTVDGKTYLAPTPFIVFATQNPQESVGTYQLPESQLDRFFMCITLGYPSPAEEASILLRQKDDRPDKHLKAVTTAKELLRIQQLVSSVYVSDELAAYIVSLTGATRTHTDVSLGASPRASLHLCRAARAWALYQGRNYVIPDDVQRMLPSVLSHRLSLRRNARLKGVTPKAVLTQIIGTVPVPVSL